MIINLWDYYPAKSNVKGAIERKEKMQPSTWSSSGEIPFLQLEFLVVNL
jgi:hypothetical protein